METFTKLLSSIVSSSIWCEDDATRCVWITMLALADQDGYVGASVPGLARIANVTVEQCQIALGKFLEPDPHSRSSEHDGRRIEIADRGWTLLNHRRVRDGRDPERRREQNRASQERYRDKHKGKPSKQVSAHTEAEAEAEADPEVENARESTIPTHTSTPNVAEPDPGTPTPETLADDLSASAVRGRAFEMGVDSRAVGRAYSLARDAAGLGKYVLGMRHHERADEALQWALVQDEADPIGAITSSARAYFRLGGDWEKSAGYPFPAWASDPGKWLALSERDARKQRARRGPEPKHETEVAPVGDAKAEIDKIMSSLKSKRGAQ